MEPVIPDLYASAPSPLPFAPEQGVRAFLLRRDAGNVLVYSASSVDTDAAITCGCRPAGTGGEHVEGGAAEQPAEDAHLVHSAGLADLDARTARARRRERCP